MPPSPGDVPSMAVRAQYGPGTVGGKRVPGYLEEEGVDPHSRTETYAALRLNVSNWRWAGVPILPAHRQAAGAQGHRDRGHAQAGAAPGLQEDGSVGVQPNQIILTVQPDEGVSVSLGAKIPGATMRIRPVNMEFRYGTSFMSESPEAYERLILDAMRGDATLFTRNDEIEALWGIIDPILPGLARGHRVADPAVPGRVRRTGRGRRRCSTATAGGGGCERTTSGRRRTRTRMRSRPRCANCCASATPPTRRWRPRGCST